MKFVIRFIKIIKKKMDVRTRIRSAPTHPPTERRIRTRTRTRNNTDAQESSNFEDINQKDTNNDVKQRKVLTIDLGSSISSESDENLIIAEGESIQNEFKVEFPRIGSPAPQRTFTRRLTRSRNASSPNIEIPELKITENQTEIAVDKQPTTTTDSENHSTSIQKSEEKQNSEIKSENKATAKPSTSLVTKEVYAGEFPKEDLITYKILKLTKFTVKGKRFHYQLYCDDFPLFHSKILREIPEEIFISKGISCHLSDEVHESVVRCDKGRETFRLRKTWESPDDAVLKISPPPIPKGIRNLNLEFFSGDDKSFQLKSLPPKMKSPNCWVPDLGSYFEELNGMESVKNCSLVNTEAPRMRYITFIRNSDTEATIVAHKSIPQLVVHLFGMASFISRAY